jgi:hypothetical protein
MISRKRYNLTPEEQARHWVAKDYLMKQKEKVYVSEPITCICDNPDHPIFTIKVIVDNPVATCYYCSKTWILEKRNG